MAYFPAFIDFNNKSILIIGGGFIAFEKLFHLLDFTKNITILSKELSSDMKKLIEENKLKYTLKSYEEGDISGFDIIIAAVDNFDLQEKIYKESRNYQCMCNCVDLQQYCDFIFPAYVKRGDLTIAISTGGSSPAMAKQLKMFLSKIIPDSIEEFLKEMKELRKTMPKGKERMKFLDKKVEKYIKSWDINNE
jgi:precorrin-2 dehydrogenase/sirohydrochlorin ferrochelatase